MAAIPDLIDFSAHTQAKAAEVDANFAALLAMLDPGSGADGGIDGVNMKQGSPGQIWVASGAGAFTRRTVTGDLSLNSSGQLTIDDGRVGSRKFNPTAGVVGDATLNKVLTLGTPVDLPAITHTITPAVASELYVTAFFDLRIVDGGHSLNQTILGYLAVDGDRQPAVVRGGGTLGKNVTTDQSLFEATVGRAWKIPLTAADHVVKLQAALDKAPGTETATVVGAEYSYLLTATV